MHILGGAKLIKIIDSAKMFGRGFGAQRHLFTFAPLFTNNDQTKEKHGWQYHFYDD